MAIPEKLCSGGCIIRVCGRFTQLLRSIKIAGHRRNKTSFRRQQNEAEKLGWQSRWMGLQSNRDRSSFSILAPSSGGAVRKRASTYEVEAPTSFCRCLVKMRDESAAQLLKVKIVEAVIHQSPRPIITRFTQSKGGSMRRGNHLIFAKRNNASIWIEEHRTTQQTCRLQVRLAYLSCPKMANPKHLFCTS
jgi:hypothetical protein